MEFGGTVSRAGGLGPSLKAVVGKGRITITHEFAWLDRANRTTTIELEQTACRFGGNRLWFRCPEMDCRRRALKLYVAGEIKCRRCLRLSYASQRLSLCMRAIQNAQKIRLVLGANGSLLDPVPDRPKGMRRGRYVALLTRLNDEENRVWPLVARRASRIARFMGLE